MPSYAWLEGTPPRRRTALTIGSVRHSSSPSSASCNLRIGTCRVSSRGFSKSVMNCQNAMSAVQAPWRPLSAPCSNCFLASRNRLNRCPSAEFSVLRSAFLIVSGRVPLARFQNARNGGSSGAGWKIAAGRLGGLAPPRALRRGARRDREERLRVFIYRLRISRRGALVADRVVGRLPRKGLPELVRLL